MSKKHNPPMSCYLRRWIQGCSPSVIYIRCLLGLRIGCSKCEGCTANVRDQIQKGFEEGLKAPPSKEVRAFAEAIKKTAEVTPEQFNALFDDEEANQ